MLPPFLFRLVLLLLLFLILSPFHPSIFPLPPSLFPPSASSSTFISENISSHWYRVGGSVCWEVEMFGGAVCFFLWVGGCSHLSIPSSPATGSQLLMKSQGVPRTAALLCFKVHFTGFGGGSGWMGGGGCVPFLLLIFSFKIPF